MKTLAQRLIAQVHIAKKDLALDDDTYRHMLMTVTGKSSCADMSERQLRQVLDHAKALGWKPRGAKTGRRKVSPGSRHKKPHEKTVVDKIRALWIGMGKAGYIRDASEKALGNYCHRMVGKHSPDWLTAWEAHRVIESLKQWRNRMEANDGKR